MTCIQRQPKCELLEEVDTPFEKYFAALGLTISGLGLIIGAWGFIRDAKVVAGVVTIGGKALGSSATVALFGGLATAVVTAIAMIVLIGLHVADRCTRGDARDGCAGGAVNGIVESFSAASDELFPFTAMHDRVDLVVKSRFWDLVESGNKYVYCTADAFPRRSEILRCYYYDPQVCAAAKGSMGGVAVGAAAGVAAAAAAAVAIGCATIILCFLAMLVAAIIVVAGTLAGAFAGGQIGKATTDPTSPEASSGQPVGSGDLITVRGATQMRAHDGGANVMWWVTRTDLHGRLSAGTPVPWSYCEIDEQLATDGCEWPPQEPPKEEEEDAPIEPPR